MDKIDVLKTQIESKEQALYNLETQNVKVDKKAIISKLKAISNFDFTSTEGFAFFINTYIDKIFLNKEKK